MAFVESILLEIDDARAVADDDDKATEVAFASRHPSMTFSMSAESK